MDVRPINTSTFDFATLIKGDFVYVDKTAQIYEIAQPRTDGLYFFARPRRFGKSLLVSTLKALFEGRRELFAGLAIERTDWDWSHEVYPVLHLDMSSVVADDAVGLEQRLNNLIKTKCADFGVAFDEGLPAASNLDNLLTALSRLSKRNGKYVMLIDEYDAPISGMLATASRRARLEDVRAKLHDFYVVAKAHSCDMRFLFVTGVTKFAKTSIFSAFNNPVDLSLDERAAELVGYTHEETETFFHDHIQAFAAVRGETYDRMKAALYDWYDSYQFSSLRLVKVVNPVSFGRALVNRSFANYWEATGCPSLVFDALKAANKAPHDFADEFSLSRLDAPDALQAPACALLYQGGYLTIDKRVDDQTVLLKIPNREVRMSLETGFISRVFGKDFEVDALRRTAEKTAAQLAAEGYSDAFKALLQSAYARLPHDWVCKDETEAKRYFLAFMVFADAEVAGETQHATGRPDAVLKTEKGIYVFEFKYKATAEAALKQCRARNYAAAFAGDGRPVSYVGVNYSPRKNIRTVNDVKCEEAKLRGWEVGKERG